MGVKMASDEGFCPFLLQNVLKKKKSWPTADVASGRTLL